MLNCAAGHHPRSLAQMKKVGDFWLPDEDLKFHWHRLWKAGKRRRKTIEGVA